MLEKVERTIKKHQLIEYGDHIIVGVSGGHDSVCLLHVLWTMKNKYNLKLTVVHLNHQYRGEAACLDAQYVEKLAEKLGLKAYIFSEDIESLSKLEGISFEEAGRMRRYGLFFKVMEEVGGNKVAVAHNRNDQVETVLMRIMRGTGIDGMQGIPYKRDDGVIRPLLDVDRKLIEAYCEGFELAPRTDYTNLDNVYTRNKIRLDLIPYIEKEFNSSFQNTLLRSLESIRGDVEFLEIQTKLALDEVLVSNKDDVWQVDRELFKTKHQAMQRRILRMLVVEFTGGRFDLSFKQVESLISMITKGVTGKVRVLSGVRFTVDYNQITLSKNEMNHDKNQWCYEIREHAPVALSQAKIRIYVKRMKNTEFKNSKKNNANQIFIDADKIDGLLKVRNRREGDRFIPFGMKGSKKVKDYFIDLKISRDQRQNTAILCDDKNIIWIVGHRMSELYRVTDKTENVMVIETETI